MLLMIRTYKYFVHTGLQQEIQIIFGQCYQLSAKWVGFQYIEKGDF